MSKETVEMPKGEGERRVSTHLGSSDERRHHYLRVLLRS